MGRSSPSETMMSGTGTRTSEDGNYREFMKEVGFGKLVDENVQDVDVLRRPGSNRM